MKASPTRDAEVMRLRDQGLTSKEVSKVLHMTEGAVTSVYSRGLVKRKEEEQAVISRMLLKWNRFGRYEWIQSN